MTNRRWPWLVVGAGFTGATLAERIATELGQRVLVIDRRPHVGGNAHDEIDSAGILVHRYGPHIFHTNAIRIWTYLSQFTGWRPYEHRVLGQVDGQLVPIPFNLTSLERLLPDRADELEAKLVSEYGLGAKVPVLTMRGSRAAAIRELAELIYERVFLNYTRKQWGLSPDALDPGVTARVPVVVSRDDRYFQDQFQAMPADGYSALFREMLNRPEIEVALRTELSPAIESSAERIIFTGPIDEYFAHAFGPLEYRSIRFEFETYDRPSVLPTGTVNFPNDHNYTRRTEFKVLTGQTAARSTVVTEYPVEHIPGVTEPYYPVPRNANRERLARYLRLAEEVKDKVVFAGRLGDYRYYNMDQAVARALALFEKVIVPLGRSRP